MLGPPSSALVAGIEALVVAGVLLGLGYLVVDVLASRRALDEASRWGLALFGLAAAAFAAMGIHLFTRGWFFAHPGIVRAVLAATIVVLLARRVVTRTGRARRHLWIAALLAGAALVIWCSPVFRMMPLTATADTQLHNGWIDQLLAGDPMFSAVLTGDVPNYYPWMFHSVGALATTLSPGGTPYHALAPLQLIQVAGSVLALFALGRALTGRALTGFGAALFGAMSGGFGFVFLDGLDVVTDPRARDGAEALLYQGDLLFSRSYNLGFHNLAPPFPRDVAFGLLISFVTLLALRARAPSAWTEIAAGCCLGFVGLTGGETFIVGAALAVVVAFADSDNRVGSAVRMLGPALAIYAVWFVPMLINYARLGGFVSITHIIAVALPATAIVVSWGLATPFALVGAIVHARNLVDSRPIRLCLLFVVVAGAALAVAAVIPEVLGDAFDTLGRKHRYWPIFYLAVALVAALGFSFVLGALRARSRVLALVALVVISAIAWTSPVVASLALPAQIGRYPGIGAAMRQQPGALLHELRELGPGCVVAAPQGVSREVFSFTGFRMLLWTGSWFKDNRARIRWAGIYDVIGSQEERIADNRTLTAAGTPPDEWQEITERRDLDVVVLPGDVAPPPGYPATATHHEDEPYTIVRIADCTRPWGAVTGP